MPALFLLFVFGIYVTLGFKQFVYFFAFLKFAYS